MLLATLFRHFQTISSGGSAWQTAVPLNAWTAFKAGCRQWPGKIRFRLFTEQD